VSLFFIPNESYADTFGYTTRGVSVINLENYIRGGGFGISANGTGISITILVDGTGTAQTEKGNIYNTDNTPLTNGQTNQITTGGSGPRTDVMNFTSAPTFVNGTTYLIEGWSNNAINGKSLAYDTATGEGRTQSAAYGTWPNPLVPVSGNERYSIYVTYTPSGGGAAPIYDEIIWFEE